MRNVRLASLLAALFDVLLYFVSASIGLLLTGWAYLAVRGAPLRPEDVAADPVFWLFQTLGLVGPTVGLARIRHPAFFRAALRFHPGPVLAAAGRGLAVGLGAAGAAVGLIVAWPAPTVIVSGDAAEFAATVWVQANVALTEETVFRGYLWFLLERRLGWAAAAGLTSLLFAFAHGANPAFSLSPPVLANLLLAGLVLAAVRRRLGFPAAVGWHFGWNAALGALFGLPVSGVTFPALVRVLDAAPVAWGGGSFGPEGGFAGTVALLASLGFVAFDGWERAGRIILKVRRVLP